MSSYIDQWKALSARISGLVKAADHRAKAPVDDVYGIAKLLRTSGEKVHSSIQAFSKEPTLPIEAAKIASKFVSDTSTFIKDSDGNADLILGRVWRFLTELLMFESEMSFMLADTQQVIRVRSERAFVHLQRLIVVDADFRKKWQAAYTSGEISCEKMGAVHLLQHGIWAFKVDAAGARTDLIFEDHPAGIDEQRYADGIVLTEWKKAASQSEADKQFAQARSQMKNYSAGVLGSIELTSYRYAIVVTEKQVHCAEGPNRGHGVLSTYQYRGRP